MQSLTSTKTEVKPQTNRYEVWCEHCDHSVSIGPEFVAGSLEDIEAVQRVDELRDAHAKENLNHRARARMHSNNIDMGADFYSWEDVAL